MKREVRITADGSSTIYVADINQTYHSMHGALQESSHVYIDAGLHHFYQMQPNTKHVKIFEMGFGTGLNALLSYAYAVSNSIDIYYEAVELYPLNAEEVNALNYPELLIAEEATVLKELHTSAWNDPIKIRSNFTLNKTKTHIQDYQPSQQFDVVYYDAFSPDSQPELWTDVIFEKLFAMMSKGGVLTTYCSKTVVRKALAAAGLEVEKLAGPRGKRDILRAFKPAR